jgi:hypothetical protein
MNKKDFIGLMLCNAVALILLIEHWCGLELALPMLGIWSIVSLIIHICVLKDYMFISVFVREDLTRK